MKSSNRECFSSVFLISCCVCSSSLSLSASKLGAASLGAELGAGMLTTGLTMGSGLLSVIDSAASVGATWLVLAGNSRSMSRISAMCSGGLSVKLISSTAVAATVVSIGSAEASLAKGGSAGLATRLTGAPHLPQNLAVIEIGFPHATQSIALPS